LAPKKYINQSTLIETVLPRVPLVNGVTEIDCNNSWRLRREAGRGKRKKEEEKRAQ